VKKQTWILLSFATLSFLFLFSSCKKINEPTEIGDELIPPIDNITTFETFFSTLTDNAPSYENDSTLMGMNDFAAIGSITNDPEFGQTNASAYFTIRSSVYGSNPFNHRDSIIGIDSVILSLSYKGSYGDTMSPQTVRVFEIDQNADLNDTTFYRFTRMPDFPTTGAQLGFRTFMFNQLNDSMVHIRKTDTSKLVNVLRIPITNSLATRFASFDTTNTSNGGFRSDSIFRRLFKGLAVKADPATGNGLGYFDLNDAANTRLTFYFRVQKGGKTDTASAYFTHQANPGGQANIVRRTPAGGWKTYLTNTTPEDDKIYLQSAPGSYATIKIPSLDTFSNNIIHRAELIVTRVASPLDNIFAPPGQLMLDRLNTTKDSAFLFDKDLVSGSDLNWDLFGGNLRSNQYRFNITRYVQDIVTNDSANRVLRLHAPLRTTVYFPVNRRATILPVLSIIADGRVVLAGGNYSDPAIRTRLRIVYSKI
jgi:hypothetical protein